MSRAFKTILVFIIIALSLAFIGYTNNLNQLKIQLIGSADSGSQKTLRYHFVVLAQNTGDTFWQTVKKGALNAGKKYDAAVEFNGSVMQNDDEELRYMRIAIASRVDGIIAYVSDEAKFTPLIDEAVSKGIHVITIESDDKGSSRNAFVGPNSYTAGIKAAYLVSKAASGESKAAMILGGNYIGNSGAHQSLLSGFSDGIRNNPQIKLLTVQSSGSESFGAEKVIRDILNDNPDVNMVICTSTDDTLEIVQVLIDLNKENSITVIGYNNTPQIREYIKNGNLFGTVYENPEQTGYQSIEYLVNSLNGKAIPDFVDTGVYTVTRSNLLSYPR